MKAKITLTICLCSFCILIALGAFFSLDKEPSSKKTVPPSQSSQPELCNTEKADTVAVPNSQTEKYILKYIESENAVYLITKKTDGTEIISPVDTIKPFYLTEEDIELLKQGIELTEREDMFILIEDYSS